MLVAHSLLVSEVLGGEVPRFDPVAAGIPRKSLKTMTRAVQLGVAAVLAAAARVPELAKVPPERRGLYVGASPQQGDAADLLPAMQAAGSAIDLAAFAERGIPLVPPLWLVKGLSNNVLGYASAMLDFRGDNGNWCDGRLGGSVALTHAVHAIAEGRVDLAIAGGADALRGAEAIVGRPCAEGAAFIVLCAEGLVGPSGRRVQAGLPTNPAQVDEVGELGAAAVPVAVARRLAGRAPFSWGGIEVAAG